MTLKNSCSSCGIIMSRKKQTVGLITAWYTSPDSGNGQCTQCRIREIPKPESPINMPGVKAGGHCVDCGIQVYGQEKRCKEHRRARAREHTRRQRELKRERKVKR